MYPNSFPVVACLLLLVSSVWANPLKRLKSRQEVFIATGVTEGGVQPRRNIFDLSDVELGLLRMGLLRMQHKNRDRRSKDEEHPQSFYQIAGIHGQPYTSWNDVEPVQGGEGTGYCVHTSQLFPTWHRPYLAYFEQVLHQDILDGLRDFPENAERDELLRVANTIRFPYWDWAANPPNGQRALPRAVAEPYADIPTPEGIKRLRNPFYRYDFHPLELEEIKHQWPYTVRHPIKEQEGGHPRSQNTRVAELLDTNLPGLRQRMYTLLTSDRDFARFTVPAWIRGQQDTTESLEGTHGEMHGMTGGGGTMSDTTLSAFDPIFWLIHCGVDRYLAMRQFLHPDSYVEPAEAYESSFTVSKGTVIDRDTELKPLRSSSGGEFWTSESVRDFTKFGYTYPEFADNANPDSLRERINELYGPSETAHEEAREHSRREKRTPSSLRPREDQTSISHEYSTYIKAAKSDTYSVYAFIGDYSQEPALWSLADGLAGIHYVLASPLNKEVQVSGTIPLSHILQRKCKTGELASMEPEDVVPYLRDNLQWRVKAADGTVVDTEKVPELLVSVAHRTLRLPSRKTEFPQRTGEFRNYPEITADKPCGAKSEDEF